MTEERVKLLTSCAGLRTTVKNIKDRGGGRGDKGAQMLGRGGWRNRGGEGVFGGLTPVIGGTERTRASAFRTGISGK